MIRLFFVLVLLAWLSSCRESKSEFFTDDNKVEIVDIDSATLHSLILNDSRNLRVLNIWATWCRPCLEEFPVFVELQTKYQDSNFEFVAVSADEQKDRRKVASFLEKQDGYVDSFIFESDSVYQLIYNESIGWNGSLPFTIVVDSSGEAIYRINEAIEPESFKSLIAQQINSN
jgi:thiol-disulfide isomerase/thioredoxin